MHWSFCTFDNGRDGICKTIPKFDLEGDETVALEIGEEPIDPQLGTDVWLVARVLSPHKVEPRIFRSVMKRYWESRNCLEICHVGYNLFSIKFGAAKDRELVLRGGPWFFNRQLIALNFFDISVNPTTIPITRVPFWIQVHGLPYPQRTASVAKSIGDAFGGFIDWDKYEANRYGLCLRVRAWLNIDAPLRRGQMVTVKGN